MSDGPPPRNRPPEREAGHEAGHDEARRRLVVWLWRLPVLLAIAGAGYGAYEAYRVIFGKGAPVAEPEFDPRPPQVVAEPAALGQVWASQDFVLDGLPAIALRLPAATPGGLSAAGGSAHYAAFSRVCTHQGCLVSLNRNLEAIAVAFNHRTDSPALVCRCHLSVFDPELAGRAVAGPAVRPLPRIQLELLDGALVAVGIEREGGGTRRGSAADE